MNDSTGMQSEMKELSKKLQKRINESERKLQEQILSSLHYSRNVYEAVEKLRQDLPTAPVREESDSLSEQQPSLHSENSMDPTHLTDNREKQAILESATDKLRMATIERKRMSSITAPGKQRISHL